MGSYRLILLALNTNKWMYEQLRTYEQLQYRDHSKTLTTFELVWASKN